MNHYIHELHRIKKKHLSNQHQIKLVIGIKRFIDQHVGSDLTLDTLAEKGHISKYHLIRLFKKYYGLTPHQYIMDRKIDLAKELLRKGNAVTETCYAVGFAGLGSFISLFRRKTGQSPSVYQKSQFSSSPNSN